MTVANVGMLFGQKFSKKLQTGPKYAFSYNTGPARRPPWNDFDSCRSTEYNSLKRGCNILMLRMNTTSVALSFLVLAINTHFVLSFSFSIQGPGYRMISVLATCRRGNVRNLSPSHTRNSATQQVRAMLNGPSSDSNDTEEKIQEKDGFLKFLEISRHNVSISIQIDPYANEQAFYRFKSLSFSCGIVQDAYDKVKAYGPAGIVSIVLVGGLFWAAYIPGVPKS
jgi:hypothetical protein